jgi:hypothetical protein
VRKPDRREVGYLTGADIGSGAVVEVVDPDQEPSARRPGEQPRQHGGAQVPDVQVGRGAGGEPTRSGWAAHAARM